MKSTTILVLCAAGTAAVGLALLALLSPARGSADADGEAPETGGVAATESASPVRLDAAHSAVPELPVEPTLAAGRVAVTQSEPVAEPPAPIVPEPGPLVGFVVDYEGRDGVPGVIVQLACTDTKLREECQTDVTGRFETEADFALRSVTARVLDPEGGGIVGTFAWEWDAERLVMRGAKRKRTGALELPVAIGPTFVFDLRPRALRSEQLRAHVVESWSAGALSGVLIRQTRRQDYYLRQTPSAPGVPIGRAFYSGQGAGRRLGRSVVERGRRTVAWGSRPVRGEGPFWIRYGRGREPKGPGYEAHLEIEVVRDRRVDQLELKTIRGVHPGVLSANPRRIQDLHGTLENSWGSPIPGAVIGLLGPNGRPVFEGWATTDSAGGFTFQDADPGDYKAVIVAEPLVPLERSIRAGEFGEPDPSPLKIKDLVGPLVGETGTPPHIGGRAWCAHGEKLLVELVPERDGQRRERRLLAPDRDKRGKRGPSDASDGAGFLFENLPQGQYELVLSPVSDRGRDHPGTKSRLRVTPRALDLKLYCGTGAGELLHYLQVVRAEAETLDPKFDPRAAFGPRGPLTDPALRLGPTDAVLLGEFPVGAPLEALAWSKGYRPVFLGPKAFKRDKQTGLAAVARAELQRGWGARLFFLDASSLVSEDLAPDDAMAAMRKWRRNPSEAVLSARPLAGVLLLDDNGVLARSDSNGIAWLVGDAQPTRIDLFLPGWRATQVDRSGIGGPLRTDVVWMVPD